ncbi:MAG: hypothetical protein IT225_09465 [Flavobacteriales bacterium]|jgi:hypothetical protein|nr:hypothetical protein [Flavobacteriales bacterium]
MKLVLALLFLPLAANAQPGDDPFLEPGCLMGSYGVALQNIDRHDVQVITTSMGTDDVPSSSGHCTRQVMLMDHADFLLENDHQGNYYLIAEPHAGDTLHPDTLKAGLASGRYRWGKSNMPICYQGYGAQFDGKGWHLMEPRTWERSIVRLSTPEAVYLVAMTVAYFEPEGRIEVRGRRVVLEGEPLPIH